MRIQSTNQFNMRLPHAGLSKYIQYYNLVFPKHDTFSEQYTLMPDACGTLSLAFTGTTVIAEVWGASVTPTTMGTEPTTYHTLFLIQLSPYGLYQITKQNQLELADKRIPLENIDAALYSALLHAFVSAESVTDLVNACDKILLKRMEEQAVSDALLLAADAISDRLGQIQVKEIARLTNYSERHLNRLFLMQIGLNVKSYARLARFNHVLKHIQKSPCFFATLSQNAGYFDQAHFDKDFKSISGVTPQSLHEKMSFFYYDPAEIFSTLSSKGGIV